MFSRAGRALTLKREPFTEAFFDSDSAADAAILVSFVAAATYVGWLLTGALASFSVLSLFSVVIGGVVSWLILGFATWFVATRLFKSSGRPQTMIALQGLAVLPLLLDIFGPIAGSVGLIWYLVVLVVGTREATDLPIKNAAVSVLIGFALVVLFRVVFRTAFGVAGGLFGALF